MRVLITGAGGFAGRYLIQELQSNGHTPVGFDLSVPDDPVDIPFYTGDLTDPAAVRDCIRQAKPEACAHLAGIAFVPKGWSDPDFVMRVNVNGTIHLLEALREIRPDTRTLVVTSSEVYGREPRAEPVKETDPLTPSNLYGVSKMAADLTALLYHRQYGHPILTARPQNHIGPGQSRLFVVSAFAEQLVELARSMDHPRMLRVGNLTSQRDFTDVRDVTRAYRLLLEKGQSGEAYNIASGRMKPVSELLDLLCERAGFRPLIEVDPDLHRPTDRPPLLAIDKIQRDTGWTPSIPLSQTLSDIYDDVAG